jgi:hypothetical protein
MNIGKSASPAFRKVDRRYLNLLGEFAWFFTLCVLRYVTLRQFKISLIILVFFRMYPYRIHSKDILSM